MFLVKCRHLRQYARALPVEAEIIGQHDAKGLISDQRFTGQNGVTQAQHFTLADHGEDAAIDHIANAGKVLLLGGPGDLMFQFVTDIKVVCDRALTTARDQRTVHHAGLDGLFDPY